jgi:hypothetical protein
MRKVISFSLFGNDPLYNIGIIRNSELKKIFFVDWEMWVYYDNTVPESTIETLKNNGVKLLLSNGMSFERSMWRFQPASDKNIDYFISRDADSRISKRDEVSVNEWILSGKDFHIIRDHPVGHNWFMNAGMWGCKGGSVTDIFSLYKSYINNYNVYDKYVDQHFLRNVIYPICQNSLFSHDEYFNYEPFAEKIKRDRQIDNFAFIGESIDINDESRYTSQPGDQRVTIIERYNKNPNHMDFTFGIITDGNSCQFVQNQIDSIKKQNILNYEIIIVGNCDIPTDKNVTIINFDENQKNSWITKKKNLITYNANYENIVFSHDYFVFEDGWYEGQLLSGNDFEIRIDKIVNSDNTRYRDWVLWTGDNDELHSIVKENAILPYDVNYMSKHQYISGGYWISKKHIMEEFPLNETLSWGESEDVEWSKRVRDKYKFTMNQNSTVKLSKYKNRVFEIMNDSILLNLQKTYL